MFDENLYEGLVKYNSSSLKRLVDIDAELSGHEEATRRDLEAIRRLRRLVRVKKEYAK